MEKEITYSTFEGFRPHFNALARVGYFQIVLKPTTSRMIRALHNAYRVFISTIVLIYNLQHVIRVILVRHNTNDIVDTLFILLTTLNCLAKQAAFNVRVQRIHNIIDVINGPTFAPKKPYHVEVLKENAKVMSGLLTFYHMAVMTCGIFWGAFPVVNRAMGVDVQFTGYFPFDTSTTLAFQLVNAYMAIAIVFQAYGNVTMDCTIVAFYAQAQTQIRILRYNLQQLVEFNDTEINPDVKHIRSIAYKCYDDGPSSELQERFKACVVHHDQIKRFCKEVESIFGEAMVVQFLAMAWVICMTVYKIVGLDILSVEFFSMGIYLNCMLAQLFIYCYYGTQLKVESDFVNQSLYCCNWLAVSPKFRRQLLLMMQCCSQAILPTVAYVIPMSLETYIAVLKSSYTLFTFLNR